MVDTEPARQASSLHAPRVLIVEDDYFIANALRKAFEQAGVEIVGPVPSPAEALAAFERQRIDGAVLDINLDGEKVYEVADTLIRREVPLVFVTGYERPSIPSRYRDVPLCLKPIDSATVVQALGRITGR